MHPKSLALTAKYEKEGLERLNNRNWRNNFFQLLENLNYHGFKEPKLGSWSNLIRIILTKNKIQGNEIHQTVKKIRKALGISNNLNISIINNNFSKEQYVDISGNMEILKIKQIFHILWQLYYWFVIRAEKISTRYLDEFINQFLTDPLDSNHPVIKKERLRIIEQSMVNFSSHAKDILKNLLRFVIKPEFRINIMSDNELPPIGLKIKYFNSGEYNDLEETYQKHQSFYYQNKDKLRELEGIKKEVKNNKGDFILCCFSAIKITKVDGKNVDEWDGLIISLSKDKSLIEIIEVKNLGSLSENEAYKQLLETKQFLNTKNIQEKRRKKIKGFGASLIIR